MYTLTQYGEYVGVPTSDLLAISESKEVLKKEAYKEFKEECKNSTGTRFNPNAKFEGDTLEFFPGEGYTIDSIEPLV